MRSTKDELIREIFRFHNENGRLPVSKEISPRYGYPSISKYRTVFGSWNNALKATGLGCNKEWGYSKEYLISELHRYRRETGVIPTKSALEDTGGNYPQPISFQRTFGSWNAAIREAGFDTYYERLNAERVIGECRSYTQYCRLAKFKISEEELRLIPGYGLLEKYGWHTGKNNGACLDHRFSRHSGFNQGIHPFIVAHPANCQFLLNADNASKNKRSEITIDELKNMIVEWENKRGTNERLLYYQELFSRKIETSYETATRYSEITGNKYSRDTLGSNDWNSPGKIKTATFLAEKFGFELGQSDTLGRIQSAISEIKSKYDAGMTPRQLQERYGFPTKNPATFMKSNLGIMLGSHREANAKILQDKQNRK